MDLKILHIDIFSDPSEEDILLIISGYHKPTPPALGNITRLHSKVIYVHVAVLLTLTYTENVAKCKKQQIKKWQAYGGINNGTV